MRQRKYRVWLIEKGIMCPVNVIDFRQEQVSVLIGNVYESPEFLEALL